VSDSPSPTPQTDLTPLIGVFLALAIANMIGVPLAVGLAATGLDAVFAGVVGAEFALAAAWGVFAPQPLPNRLLSTMLLAIGFGVTLLMGILLASWPSMTSVDGDVFAAALMLPLCLLAVQCPLCALKLLRGVAISAGDVEPETSPHGSRQFGLSEMLTVTAWVALAFGLAQLAVQLASPFAPSFGWPQIGLACGVSGLWGLLVFGVS